MSDVVIRPIRPEERETVLALLGEARLPTEGLERWWDMTLVAAAEDRIVGSAALELYSDDAVLRSVCVIASCRGERLGHELVAAALELASDQGIREVYLLTETAERFFGRLGFRVVQRDAVPEPIQESIEFRGLCPAGATAMALRLTV